MIKKIMDIVVKYYFLTLLGVAGLATVYYLGPDHRVFGMILTLIYFVIVFVVLRK